MVPVWSKCSVKFTPLDKIREIHDHKMITGNWGDGCLREREREREREQSKGIPGVLQRLFQALQITWILCVRVQSQVVYRGIRSQDLRDTAPHSLVTTGCWMGWDTPAFCIAKKQKQKPNPF